MGKTISAFFQFILDDPIMLGLCIAIAVLIVLFIIVLILGKRADKTNDNSVEKEEELLKTEVDLSMLSNLGELESKSEVITEFSESIPEEVGESIIQNIDEIEVPVVHEEEPVKLEVETSTSPLESIEVLDINEDVESKNEVFEPPIEAESIPSFEDFRIETPTEEEIREITQELNVVEDDIVEKLSEDVFEESFVEHSIEEVSNEISDTSLEQLTQEETNTNYDNSWEQFTQQEPSVTEEESLELLTQAEANESENDSLGVLSVEETVSETPVLEPIVDLPVKEETEVVAEPAPVEFDASDYIYEPGPLIVESAVNPVDESDNSETVPSLSEQSAGEYKTGEIELPIVEEGIEIETIASEEKLSETPQTIYAYEEDELPEINVEDFSRTALIRHIPVLDIKASYLFNEDDEEDGDIADLDLPKLNKSSSEATSFNSLKGESFDIPKNS